MRCVLIILILMSIDWGEGVWKDGFLTARDSVLLSVERHLGSELSSFSRKRLQT